MLNLPNLKSALRNHPRWFRLYDRFRRNTLRLLPAPDYRQIHDLAAVPAALPRVCFQRPAASVEGWLTDDEATALYVLARMTAGSSMEIGAWLGRSTICLARGLIDGGNPTSLLSCELAPTPENFRETKPGWVGFFYPANHLVSMGDCPVWEFELGIKPVISRPGGILGQLETNLRDANVRDQVELRVGDFRCAPSKPFDLVFCDAMHGEVEISRNGPDLKRFLQPNSVLACHDSDAGTAAILKRYFLFSDEVMIDSLLIGRIREVL